VRVRTRSRLAALALLATSTVASLGVAEWALRRAGHEPWRVAPLRIELEPEGSLFQPHPTLGYAHRPGAFTVREGALAFRMTHGPDALRITHPPRPGPAGPGLWIFGCSFTHGWSVDDEETYPWLVQEAFPRAEVVNFGVSGYGTLQAWIQLEEALAVRPPPAAAVVAYGSFHDDRNTFARERRKIIVPWNRLGPLSQPAARLDRSGALRVGLEPFTFREVPGMRSLALAHLLERAFSRAESRWLRGPEVTRALLDRFAARASEAGVRFVLAGVYADAATRETLAWNEARGRLGVDLAVDVDDRRFNNLPWDPHPSASAHRVYAGRLARFLREHGLLPAGPGTAGGR
jgi:hypothetical protein